MTEPDMITPAIFLAGYFTGYLVACFIDWIERGQRESRQPKPENSYDDHQ